MNLKLNIKVLLQMEEDFARLAQLAQKIGDPEVKAKFEAEITEKYNAVRLLKLHYQSVLLKVETLNQR